MKMIVLKVKKIQRNTIRKKEERNIIKKKKRKILILLLPIQIIIQRKKSIKEKELIAFLKKKMK